MLLFSLVGFGVGDLSWRQLQLRKGRTEGGVGGKKRRLEVQKLQ